MYEALDYNTGRLAYYQNSIYELVAFAWRHQYTLHKDSALAHCRDQNATFRRPKFKIEIRPVPFLDHEKRACLCLEAGIFDLAHIVFPEISYGDALNALNIAKKQGLNPNLDYAA